MDTPSKELRFTLHTELEHTLYEHYNDAVRLFKEEKQERKKLQGLVENMRNQIEVLQEQLKCVAESTNMPSTLDMETSLAQAEYVTDEEELVRESEWIRAKSRKKWKLNTSPTISPQGNDNNPIIEKTKKIPPPPPIIVDGVKNYQNFYDSLSQKQPAGTFRVKILNGESVKVNAINDEAYRALTKILSESNCPWHSYENKLERPIRVMVKKLPSTCKPDRIIEDLKGRGYKIEEAVNKLSWRNKEPLNMFTITFSNEEDIKKVYEIKHILGCVVEIQPLRSTKLIPQCKRCQVYGHTQKYCSKEPRCVKCTGKHLTKDCKKPAEEKPKCVHCGEAHPSNYRGCMIAKEMQKMRNKNTKKTPGAQQIFSNKHQVTLPGSYKNNIRTTSASTTQKSVSYAQATAKNTLATPRNEPSNNNKLDEILKFMSSFDERLKKIENSTKLAVFKNKQ